jgi:anti-anti-sigma factor
MINRMLGAIIGPAGHPESPPIREEPTMPSPVFPVPLIPLQPARPGPAVPQPRDPGAPDRLDPAEFDTAEFDTAEFDAAGTPLTITVEDRDDVCVVHADGEVDIATTHLLSRALEAGLAGGRPTVVVDLRQVSFVDCTGIGLLTAARCRARDQGTRLRILAGRAVARTAALLELTTALGLHEAA